MRRSLFNEDHEAFRATLREFIAREVEPFHPEWEKAGHVPRELYRKLGALGVLGIEIPEEYGGAGQTSVKYMAVLMEECARAAVTLGTVGVHAGLLLHYLVQYGTEEQKKRWLPGCVSGDIWTAVAMTEPGTGSDLAGVSTRATLSEDGSSYILNGAKTFITGGVLADLVIVVCRTSPASPDDRRTGLSLLCVETTSEGFAVGRKLDKIGMKASDTAELSFTDVEVPVDNLLGQEGRAFEYLRHNLVRERLHVAIQAAAEARAAIDFTVRYVKERKVFDEPLSSFQNTKFVLAECAAEAEAAQAMVDRAMELFDADELTSADAAKVKLVCTEVVGRVVDKCLQLHGGYGYILEYPIARLYTAVRVNRIYAGTSEVQKTVIAKSLGL
jgi:acyl-CoA dehydrogenase